MEENKEKNQKANWNVKPYLAVALLTFLVFCGCITVFFMIYRYEEFRGVTQKFMVVLQPVSIGLVIAYLINPIMKFYEKGIEKLIEYIRKQSKGKTIFPASMPWIKKKDSEKKSGKNLTRTLATIGAMLTFVLIIIALFSMVIPELVVSIEGLVVSLPDQVNNFVDWSNKVLDSDNEIINQIETALVNTTSYLENWLKQDLLPQAQTYIASITTGIISVVKVFFNAIIGLIISVYVLVEKEKFTGQFKKIIYAIFKPSVGNNIIVVVRKSNDIFGGFISGKILDSCIIGVLCYIVLLIMHMPYALLVSVIVGVTNVIPFFGPYIGAVPSTILILLADPIMGVYFVIFILILQQIDGNIIGPKILGDSTGLSSFWVVFAILVGGGLFGVAGMILGVPVFAVIYYLADNAIKYCLRKKRLPEATDEYIYADKVNVQSNHIEYMREAELAGRAGRLRKKQKEKNEKE